MLYLDLWLYEVGYCLQLVNWEPIQGLRFSYSSLNEIFVRIKPFQTLWTNIWLHPIVFIIQPTLKLGLNQTVIHYQINEASSKSQTRAHKDKVWLTWFTQPIVGSIHEHGSMPLDKNSLSYMTYLVAVFILPYCPTYCTFLVSSLLNLVTHALLCHITKKPSAWLNLITHALLCHISDKPSALVQWLRPGRVTSSSIMLINHEKYWHLTYHNYVQYSYAFMVRKLVWATSGR